MKMVLSPAKKLNLKNLSARAGLTEPLFIKKAEYLQKILREKTQKELAQLMNLSENLAEKNWKQNQIWTTAPRETQVAVSMFNGDLYKALEVDTLDENAQNYLQKHTYILSGLYGLLRPYDLVAPYRLLMSTPIEVKGSKNLYQYWQESITEYLNKDLEHDGILIDLASQEYTKVIDRKKFKGQIVRCIFKQYKNDTLKTVMIYAKRARGLMARFIAEKQAHTPEDLKRFDKEGYRFNKSISKNTTLVFTR